MPKKTWLNSPGWIERNMFFWWTEISSITARTPSQWFPIFFFTHLFRVFVEENFPIMKRLGVVENLPLVRSAFSTFPHSFAHLGPPPSALDCAQPASSMVLRSRGRVDVSTLAMGRMTLGASNREGDKWLIPWLFRWNELDFLWHIGPGVRRWTNPSYGKWLSNNI